MPRKSANQLQMSFDAFGSPEPPSATLQEPEPNQPVPEQALQTEEPQAPAATTPLNQDTETSEEAPPAPQPEPGEPPPVNQQEVQEPEPPPEPKPTPRKTAPKQASAARTKASAPTGGDPQRTSTQSDGHRAAEKCLTDKEPPHTINLDRSTTPGGWVSQAYVHGLAEALHQRDANHQVQIAATSPQARTLLAHVQQITGITLNVIPGETETAQP